MCLESEKVLKVQRLNSPLISYFSTEAVDEAL